MGQYYEPIVKRWIPDMVMCAHIDCGDPAVEPGGGHAYFHDCDEDKTFCSKTCAEQYAKENHLCPRCEGDGLESPRMKYMHPNDPDLANCPECDGNGWVKIKK